MGRSFADLGSGIFLIEFETQEDLASSFCRFQEHYESPEFKGKVFSSEEFHEHYERTRGRKYSCDWAGFNVPDYIFDPFLRGQFCPLSESEAWIVDCVRNLPRPFYLIGIVSGDDGTLGHEYSHGLYYLNSSYRSEVFGIISRVDTKSIQEVLKGIGYREDVMVDEVQAYLVWERDFLTAKNIQLDESLNKAAIEIEKEFHFWGNCVKLNSCDSNQLEKI